MEVKKLRLPKIMLINMHISWTGNIHYVYLFIFLKNLYTIFQIIETVSKGAISDIMKLSEEIREYRPEEEEKVISCNKEYSQYFIGQKAKFGNLRLYDLL